MFKVSYILKINQSINSNNQNMPRAEFTQSGMLYQTKYNQFPNK